MTDVPEDQHDKENTGGHPRLNLQEMARHLHAADEAALDEGIIVSSFSSLQLPSWRELGVDLPNPVDSFFNESPHKVVDPDVESVDSVEADADLQTVHDHAVP